MEKENRYYAKRNYKRMRPAYDALIANYPFTVESLPDELWKPIPDYEDYHCSTYGRIKSFKRGRVTILRPALHSSCYMYVNISNDKGSHIFHVHRLVALLFVPNPDGKPQISHLDGNCFNNHVSNLTWSTRPEISKRITQKGRVRRGVNNPNAAFTEADVIYIRDNPDRLTINQLAKKFSVTPKLISYVQIGKRYKAEGGTIRPRRTWTINPADRQYIKDTYKKGSRDANCYTLADQFGVNPSTIWKIVRED